MPNTQTIEEKRDAQASPARTLRVSVFGMGYVGSVSAACMAQRGHHVVGLDVSPQKVALLKAGRPPVVEKGLDELVRDGVATGALEIGAEPRAAVMETDLSLICVGTPSKDNGSLNLEYLEGVCQQIGEGLAAKDGYHVVVVRSTVLPGITEEYLIPILEEHSGKRAGVDFGVCMHPEFLREGSAIDDYYNPGLIVIGELDERSGEPVEALYDGIPATVVRTNIRTGEMIKYANNAFHALKVTFANEIGVFAREHGIDGRDVMAVLVQDKRLNISPAYLRPGFAFGGSCLPKDLRALLHRAKERDLECGLLGSILPSNQRHVERGVALVEGTGHKKVGVLGLSFKAGTDDLRESPVVTLVERLVGKGYSVRIYDDTVELGRLMGTNKSFLEQQLPHIARLMAGSVQEVVDASEVLVITSNSPGFRGAPEMMRSDQVLVDLVGIVKDRGEIQGEYEGICW